MHADAVSWLTGLEERLGSALGQEICVVCTDTDGDPDSLWPQEQAAVRHAVAKRQREFAAGRTAARLALHRLGLPACAIAARADRSPDWPQGVVGSISHAGGLCVVVLARSTDVARIGIDVEPATSVDESLWPSICTPRELASVLAAPAHERTSLATRVFTAKEAFYKWQFAATQALLDFQDARVVDLGGDRFHVERVHPRGDLPSNGGAEGRWMVHAGFSIAWLIQRVGHPQQRLCPHSSHVHV